MNLKSLIFWRRILPSGGALRSRGALSQFRRRSPSSGGAPFSLEAPSAIGGRLPPSGGAYHRRGRSLSSGGAPTALEALLPLGGRPRGVQFAGAPASKLFIEAPTGGALIPPHAHLGWDLP